MAEYEAILQALPFHDLRGIATYLRLEPAATVTKKQLLATIIAYWHHAESQRQGVQRLSPAAQRALWWLCHTVAVPAAPFWAEFGDVRRARSSFTQLQSPGDDATRLCPVSLPCAGRYHRAGKSARHPALRG